jgi:hypothetical protein
MNPFRNQFDTSVLSMAILRFISAAIECTAAILMLYFNDGKKALIINSMLAVVGPIIFILTTTIGLVSISATLSYGKLILIGIGVFFIVIGIVK